MNWIEIQRKNPKAFEKWFENEGYQKDEDFRDFHQFACELEHFEKAMIYIRDLFDFFDEQGIYISIYFNMLEFSYCITYDTHMSTSTEILPKEKRTPNADIFTYHEALESAEKELEDANKEIKELKKENTRLLGLIETAFYEQIFDEFGDAKLYEQFKKENNLNPGE